MRILVTGGAGFIGANLCERLVADGNEVVCLDNFYSSSKENVEDLDVEVVDHDVTELLPAMGKFDQIYHLACPASPPRYQKDHVFTLRTSFEGTLNVLEYCKKNGGTMLFTSTSEVYGDPKEHPQKESYRGDVNPHGIRSCYDEGKRAAESLCMNFWRQHGVDVKIVRIFNTYGPRMDAEDGRVVSNFIMQALRGEDLTIYGDGGQSRSFQYVEDLLDGMIAMMGSDFVGPVNVGNPDEFTILEFAEKIKEMVPGDYGLVYKDLPGDDPMQRCPDISLAKEKLDWEPKVTLDEGLKKTIEYFRQKL